MTLSAPLASAEAFFLDASPGQRFCLFHPPAAGACRGALVYVHPFADEMNRSRRMAALQARDLAAAGFGVLQIDLYGCGDSSGEFGEARWDLWKQDVAAATRWIGARLGQPVTLLGLRLGALLALDFALDAEHAAEHDVEHDAEHGSAPALARLVLWQPVLNGATFLHQFLRLLTANELLADDPPASDQRGSRAPRAALLKGHMIEVGGYDIAPELASAIAASDAAQMVLKHCPVDWFETAAAGQAPAPAVARLASRWQQQGVALTLHQVSSPPFWASQERAESAPLVAATTALLSGSGDAMSRTRA